MADYASNQQEREASLLADQQQTAKVPNSAAPENSRLGHPTEVQCQAGSMMQKSPGLQKTSNHVGSADMLLPVLENNTGSFSSQQTSGAHSYDVKMPELEEAQADRWVQVQHAVGRHQTSPTQSSSDSSAMSTAAAAAVSRVALSQVPASNTESTGLSEPTTNPAPSLTSSVQEDHLLNSFPETSSGRRRSRVVQQVEQLALQQRTTSLQDCPTLRHQQQQQIYSPFSHAASHTQQVQAHVVQGSNGLHSAKQPGQGDISLPCRPDSASLAECSDTALVERTPVNISTVAAVELTSSVQVAAAAVAAASASRAVLSPASTPREQTQQQVLQLEPPTDTTTQTTAAMQIIAPCSNRSRNRIQSGLSKVAATAPAESAVEEAAATAIGQTGTARATLSGFNPSWYAINAATASRGYLWMTVCI
jgi:hypothetical protein